MSYHEVPQALSEKYDYLAPDGSEIRLLVAGKRGGLCHCTLKPGSASHAVRHYTVEEMWYCLSGEGEVWRQGLVEHEVVVARPGVSLVIPTGVAFQFRNTGADDLTFLIATCPPWPGPEEAQPAIGRWS